MAAHAQIVRISFYLEKRNTNRNNDNAISESHYNRQHHTQIDSNIGLTIRAVILPMLAVEILGFSLSKQTFNCHNQLIALNMASMANYHFVGAIRFSTCREPKERLPNFLNLLYVLYLHFPSFLQQSTWYAVFAPKLPNFRTFLTCSPTLLPNLTCPTSSNWRWNRVEKNMPKPSWMSLITGTTPIVWTICWVIAWLQKRTRRNVKPEHLMWVLPLDFWHYKCLC